MRAQAPTRRDLRSPRPQRPGCIVNRSCRGGRGALWVRPGLTEKANHYYKLFINWTNEKIKKTFVKRYVRPSARATYRAVAHPACPRSAACPRVLSCRGGGRNMFDFRHIQPFERSYADNPEPMVLFASPGMLHAGASGCAATVTPPADRCSLGRAGGPRRPTEPRRSWGTMQQARRWTCSKSGRGTNATWSLCPAIASLGPSAPRFSQARKRCGEWRPLRRPCVFQLTGAGPGARKPRCRRDPRLSSTERPLSMYACRCKTCRFRPTPMPRASCSSSACANRAT